MRPQFERDLRDYSDLAKDQVRLEAENQSEAAKGEAGPDREMIVLSGAIDWHLKQAARSQQTTEKVQREIFDIQKDKQDVMVRLRERLACLGNPDCRPEPEPGSRAIAYDESRETYVYSDADGKNHDVTLSEMVTDLEWGINYALDTESPPPP